VSGLSEVALVAAGYGHTLALRVDGAVWAWGDNNSRQLGDGTIPQGLTPSPVGGLSGAVAAGCGRYAQCSAEK
jgi:alpha-tubulin suppressor-like RCC1 family protein